MSLTRQGKYFLVAGFLQWILDWAVTVALSHAGLALEIANVIGRISGATLGFWLNGRFTFADHDFTLGRAQLLRFLVLWLVTTFLSTLIIGAIGRHAALQWAWLAKPLVEASLAVSSFFVSRHWVYR